LEASRKEKIVEVVERKKEREKEESKIASFLSVG
jgi:hypothetical protein